MHRFALLPVYVALVVLPLGAQQRPDPLIGSTDDPLVLQQYAIAFYRQNRPQDALAALRKSAAVYNGNAETHMWLGVVYTRLDEMDTAKVEFERALELNPGLTEAHNWFGLYWVRLGQLERAIEHYRVALDDPAYPRVSRARGLLNLGNALMQRDGYNEATEYLSQAFRIPLPSNDPAFTWVRLALAESLIKTGRPDEALSVLEELNVLPDIGRAEYLAGLAYRDLGEIEKARDRLGLVLRLEPGSALATKARQVLSRLPDGNGRRD